MSKVEKKPSNPQNTTHTSSSSASYEAILGNVGHILIRRLYSTLWHLCFDNAMSWLGNFCDKISTIIKYYRQSPGTHGARNVMMTSSIANIFRVTGPFLKLSTVIGGCPSQRPVMRSFGVFLDLLLNKRLSKQSWRWWFETPPRSL